MEKIFAFLRAIRLLDENNQLSLTNIALIVVLVYMLRRPEMGVQEIMALAGALASYQFKRWMQPDTAGNDSEELKKTLADLQTKVASLQLQGSLRK